jgi:hypothetical protein
MTYQLWDGIEGKVGSKAEGVAYAGGYWCGASGSGDMVALSLDAPTGSALELRFLLICAEEVMLLVREDWCDSVGGG